MSSRHESLWLPQNSSYLVGENLGYENSSRLEQKRDHQRFMNTDEPETFSNKKQALEAPLSGVFHLNVSPWDTNSGLHSVTGQFSDRLFGSDLGRAINLVDKTESGSLNVARRDVENQYVYEPFIGLSRSHPIADTSSDPNFNITRKVKVNQVNDSFNLFPSSIGSNYNNENDNIIAMGSGISKTNSNPVSMGHSFNIGDGSSMPIHQTYGLSMSEPFNRTDFLSMDQSHEKVDSNLISLGSSSHPKGHENFIPMSAIYSKSAEDFINTSPFYGKGIDHMLSLGPTCVTSDSSIPPTGNSSSSLVAHDYNEGESSSMPFVVLTGNPEPNPSVGIMDGYNPLMENQSLLAEGLDSQNKDQISPDAEQQAVKTTQTTGTQTDTTTQKNKEKNKEKKTRKPSSNNFPSNVKSLLSTGIYDGVPVKYVSWSREKTLGAVIKGTGYVCSCDECKEPKPLNAYEFERHAGSKTKHPNNHIYFENGKTVYGVVQELKNTPQEMLFDVIQNITGSNVNQKNFQSWKASYQAAAKELQRIYGANEVTTLQS